MARTSSPSIQSNPSLITSGINGCTNYMSTSKQSFNRNHSPMSSPSPMPPMISSPLSQMSHPPPPPPSAFFGNPGMTTNQYFHHAYNALGMGFRGPHMSDLSSMANLQNDKSGNPFNPFGPLLLPDLSKCTPTSTVTTATLAQQLDRQRHESQQQSQNESNTETVVTCQSKTYLCPNLKQLTYYTIMFRNSLFVKD